jgi:UDP-N-acetyl-D-galactosamine dehydrogenase
MGKFIAEQTVKQLAARGQRITGATVNMLGLTFKENCSDLRNSRVPDIIEELAAYGCRVTLHDPLADASEAASEYGLQLTQWPALSAADVVILAVPHKAYVDKDFGEFRSLLADDGLLVDVKGMVNRDEAVKAGVTLWRL